MTCTRRLIAIFLFAGFLVRPLPTAALPRILPKCDVATVYYVVKGETKEQSMSEEAYYKQAESVLKNNQVLRTVIDKNKNCGFDEFMQLFVNLANWGFAILAATALIFFLYGGFNLLIAGGRTEYVQRGKQVVVGTFLGSLVALVSWAAINTVYTALNVNSKYELRGGRGAGGASNLECRKSWSQRCTGLKYKCADRPTEPNGLIRQFQQLLADKCPECGIDIDGCFGPQTAGCLWRFMATNNLNPPENLEAITANEAVRRAVQDPQSKSCSPSIDVIEPPPSDREPTLDAGCCVTSNLNYGCFAMPMRSCPVDIPSEGYTPSYHFVEGDCANQGACQNRGCCVTYTFSGGVLNSSCCSTVIQSNCPSPGAFQSVACSESVLCPVGGPFPNC